jgi:hypothetical protein
LLFSVGDAFIKVVLTWEVAFTDAIVEMGAHLIGLLIPESVALVEERVTEVAYWVFGGQGRGLGA